MLGLSVPGLMRHACTIARLSVAYDFDHLDATPETANPPPRFCNQRTAHNFILL
jgi:hypothetical protein